MSRRVTLIDYGIGNLFNLLRAFEHVGASTQLITDVDSIRSADKLVLPGVGAFGAGITNLKSLGLTDAIKEFKKTGKPVFGICLGMQLLFSTSEELGNWDGLEIVSGSVLRFPSGSWKLPHIAWNSLSQVRPWKGTVLEGLKEGDAVYFNHSYYVAPTLRDATVAVSNYADTTFSAVIHHENVAGCQFHPERSGSVGLKILSNFTS